MRRIKAARRPGLVGCGRGDQARLPNDGGDGRRSRARPGDVFRVGSRQGGKRWMAAALMVLASCGDDFDPASKITSVRLLGARVEPVGDPQRAWPRPGEEVEISHVVVGPEGGQPSVGFAALACVDAPTPRGVPQCVGPAFTAVGGDEAVGPVPRWTLTVPGLDALAGSSSLRVFGAVCPGAPLRFDGSFDLTPDTLTKSLERACAPVGEEEVATTFTYSVLLSSELAGENLHPRFLDDSVRVNDVVLVAPSEVTPKCDGDEGVSGAAPRFALPAEEKQRELRVDISVDGNSREVYTKVDDAGDPQEVREVLQLAVFVTDGEVDRQFAFFEDANAQEGEVASFKWRPGDNLPAGEGSAVAVRLLLTLRDGRGGFATLERHFCVLP